MSRAAFAAVLCVASALADTAKGVTTCVGKQGDDLDLCLGGLCHPSTASGLAGKGCCWHEGKYIFAQGGLYNSGDACGTSAADFMCKRCARGTSTPASATQGFSACVATAGAATAAPTAAATAPAPAGAQTVCFTLAACGCVVLPSGELKGCNPPVGTKVLNLNGALIEGTKITDVLPGAFLGLNDVTEVNLGKHAISRLRDDAFKGMPKLTTLTLRENSISTLSVKAFAGLESLDTLDLAINAIREIPSDIFAGLSPRTVVLSSNPMTAPGVKCPQDTMRVTLMAASADVCYSATTATATTTTTAAPASTAAPAPTECAVGAWGAWSGCLPTCGASRTRTRERALTKVGVLCAFQLLESEACAPHACPAVPSAVQAIVDVSDTMQQGQYPWLMGGGGKNIQPSAAACEALCLNTRDCVYGTFVTGSAKLTGAFHNYNANGMKGECWLSATTHAATKRCDVPCHSFRKAPKVPTPAPEPVKLAVPEPRFRAKSLDLYDPCTCDPRMHQAKHITCHQDPFGGHIFMTHLGPRINTDMGAPGGLQHRCALVGKNDCRCCTCQGEAKMHSIRDLKSGMHAEVSQFLFGGGRANLVPSLALCKRKCYETNGCTTGTYILEGSRKGQCWLSGEVVGAGAGKPIPLLSCGVPCRSFVKGDGGWERAADGSLQRVTTAAPDPLAAIRGGESPLLGADADGYVRVPDSLPATLPRILEVNQPPVEALSLDEQLVPEPAQEEGMPAQPEDEEEEDEEEDVGGVGALFRGGNQA